MRRGLVPSRAVATAAVEAGRVTVDGAPALTPGRQVLASADVVLLPPPPQHVSRGGDKLAHALAAFDVQVAGRRCLDAGISTGGFTDCLLQHAAAHVVGVDVGYGQVAERVRTDERVEVRERTNIRDVTPADLGAPVELVVCDVSFIALRTVLPTLLALVVPDGDLVALVKPQFEAPRDEVGDGGVVRDPAVWERVLREVADRAAELGWPVVDVTASPLPGPAGNVEFLVHARRVRHDDEAGRSALVLQPALERARELARAAGVTLVEAP